MKRVLAIGDLHCGHAVGLTPPAWMSTAKGTEALAGIQLTMWKHFDIVVKKLGKIDLLLVNGDAIDGKGGRSGSTEQIEVDFDRQAEMAADCIKHIGADKIIMTRGTPYHVVNEGTAVEDQIAKEVGAHIGGHEWVDVNGLIFDIKHKVGGSGIPHGRVTAIKREALWNTLWAERETNPRSDIILRSHVHYHEYSGNTRYLAMTLPALQGPGSKYGVEQCSGVVDFGLVHFDVNDTGEYRWASHILPTVIKQTAIQC